MKNYDLQEASGNQKYTRKISIWEALAFISKKGGQGFFFCNCKGNVYCHTFLRTYVGPVWTAVHPRHELTNRAARPRCCRNNACIVLATTDTNFKPRTEHISLKYHYLNDQVKSGSLNIIKLDTNKNWADIFTKHLSKQTFESL